MPRPIGVDEAPPRDARYVSTMGDDATGDGSVDAPWRSLGAAVRAVPTGTTIVLREGTYRESVTWEDKAIRVQARAGEEVWLSGSIEVDGWVRDGRLWRRDGWDPELVRRDVNPILIDPGNPVAEQPDLVFLDGQPLRQVASRSALVAGTFQVDTEASAILLAEDPAGRVVEAAVLGEALTVRGDGSAVVGLGFRHYATNVNRLGAVRAWSDDLVITDNVFVDNAAAGLSVIGTDSTVTRNRMERNGQLGLHAHQADGLLVEDNLFGRNNSKGFAQGSAVGGFKITASRDVVIRDNVAVANDGPGIWVDESSLDVVIVRNLAQGNTGHGLMYEISARGLLASNVSVGNDRNGLYVLESNDVGVWNNTLVDNGTNLLVLDGDRTSQDVDAVGHDRRFMPDPAISWDVDGITIRNNLLVDRRQRTTTLLRVDDAERRRSAESMAVTLDANGNPRDLIRWSRWPTQVVPARTIQEVRVITGQEEHGVLIPGDARVFADVEDLRLAPSSPARGAGMPLPPRVQRWLDVELDPGEAVDLGALHLGS
jgi:hypothetical protein